MIRPEQRTHAFLGCCAVNPEMARFPQNVREAIMRLIHLEYVRDDWASIRRRLPHFLGEITSPAGIAAPRRSVRLLCLRDSDCWFSLETADRSERMMIGPGGLEYWCDAREPDAGEVVTTWIELTPGAEDDDDCPCFISTCGPDGECHADPAHRFRCGKSVSVPEPGITVNVDCYMADIRFCDRVGAFLTVSREVLGVAKCAVRRLEQSQSPERRLALLADVVEEPDIGLLLSSAMTLLRDAVHNN